MEVVRQKESPANHEGFSTGWGVVCCQAAANRVGEGCNVGDISDGDSTWA